MKFIGFIGLKGVGKDTCADVLKKEKIIKDKLAFARPLKAICTKIFDLPSPIVNDPNLKDTPFKKGPVTITKRHIRALNNELETYVPTLNFIGDRVYRTDIVDISNLENTIAKTPRELLQIIGTNYIRNKVYKDWHVEAAFSDLVLRKLTKSGIYAITDIRFENEFLYLKNKFKDAFITYYIERNQDREEDLHESELNILELKKLIPEENIITNNDSLTDLEELVKNLQLPKGDYKLRK